MASTISQLIRGDTYRWAVTITQNGAPVDITGWILSCTVKPAVDDDSTDAAAMLKVDHTFPADGNSAVGVGSFELPEDETFSLVPGNAVIDMQVRIPAVGDGNPTIKTVMPATKIKVLGDVTRRRTFA